MQGFVPLFGQGNELWWRKTTSKFLALHCFGITACSLLNPPPEFPVNVVWGNFSQHLIGNQGRRGDGRWTAAASAHIHLIGTVCPVQILPEDFQLEDYFPTVVISLIPWHPWPRAWWRWPHYGQRGEANHRRAWFTQTHLKSPMPEKDEPKELPFISISELHLPRSTATFSGRKKKSCDLLEG